MALPTDPKLIALRKLQEAARAKPSMSMPGSSASAIAPRIAEQQQDLRKTEINAATRIMSDPIALRNDPEAIIASLKKIAGGEQPGPGGLLGLAGKAVGKGLQGLGYVLGRPLAVVASVGKEISDIPSGQASFGDLVQQTFDPETAVSKFLPKSGNKWIDGIVGLVGDIALDPLTYVTFGASAFAGRSGRMALAAKAAEEANLAKIPSLAAKIADGSIARYGEWALTKAEKEALGIKSGVSWAFGSKDVIGREGTLRGALSEKAAAAVGKPFALGRARVGDVPIFRPLQQITTPKSVKDVGLTMYGRVKDTPDVVNNIAKLAAYSASARASGAGRIIQLKFGSRNQDLARQVGEYEATTGRRIHEVIEGVRPAADTTEKNLADSITKALGEMRAEANARTAEFAGRRGANAYQIGSRENYVPHTLTPEARAWIAGKNWGDAKGRMVSNLKEMLGISPSEFKNGPGPLRARTLNRKTKWLGEELKTSIDNTVDGPATMAEINRISNNELGFKWFEEDGAQYVSNYLDSIVSQTKRVAFTDRLFDYGPDVVQTYAQKIVPNSKLAKQYGRTIRLIDSMTNDVLNDFVGRVSTDVEDVLGPRIELAKAIADSRPGDAILSPESAAKVQDTLSKIVDSIAESDGVARGLPSDVREAYETMMEPVRARVADMRAAIDANDQEYLGAMAGLRDLYQRIYPDADGIPGNPKALAEDIVDGIAAMRGAPGSELGVLQMGEQATRAAQGLEVPVPGGAVYATPEDAKKALANLEEQLRIKQANLDARLALEQAGQALPGQAAAGVAREDIGKLQSEIADITAKRDEALAEATSRRVPGEPTRTPSGTRVSPVEKEIKNISVSAQRKTARRQQEISKLQPTVDAVTPLDIARDEWDATVGAIYRNDIDNIAKVAAERPADGVAGEMTAQWLQKTIKTIDAVNAPGIALSPAERDVFGRVLTTMKGLEAELADLEMARSFNVAQFDRAISGDLAKVVDDTIKGWEKIESLGVQMPPEIRDMMYNKVRSLTDPANANALFKTYKEYTKYFKVFAMLTPGFLVRNAYTAAFNNFVAGVTFGEAREGLSFATRIFRNGLDEALSSVPAAERNLYERALEVAYSSGAGQTADDILSPLMNSRSKNILDRKGIKGWSKLNEGIEVGARFSLALSSLRRGMDYDAALKNVARYHFDYSDLSSLDEFMRAWIPFWTFSSRNIPLQIVNQAARPSLYRRYQALQRNFGISEEDKTAYPDWLRDRNPLQFPGMPKGAVINPDLPFLDMQEQTRMFSDPMRLLSQANPLVRLPIELAGGRQLYQNIPFKDAKADVRGPLDWPALLAGLVAGGAGRRPDGSFYTTQRASYALPALLPPLAQLQRILPKIPFTNVTLGGKDSYQDRQGSSIAGYVGLPYRRVGPNEQFNELLRRQFEISKYLSNLTRTGYLTPKNQR